ncbi:MAG: hypothetical protein QN229_06730 [Desulfurococcaceae archaeon TW002]
MDNYYINGVWFYGAELKTPPKRILTTNPAVMRVFLGLLLLVIASWLFMLGYNVNIALIIIDLHITRCLQRERINEAGDHVVSSDKFNET